MVVCSFLMEFEMELEVRVKSRASLHQEIDVSCESLGCKERLIAGNGASMGDFEDFREIHSVWGCKAGVAGIL